MCVVLQLNVLKEFHRKFPDIILGLSDHTPGHATVLGAISLGARIIEKHFTLSNKLEGPDHKFSMNPKTWSEMIQTSRELELSLGTKNKIIEKNELETSLVQRRSIHTSKEIKTSSEVSIALLIKIRIKNDRKRKPSFQRDF